MNGPVPLEIKVCGIRTVDGIAACVRAGVDFVGLNFAPGSRRRVEPMQARELRRALGSAPAIGVFRDQPLEEVLALAEAAELTWLQLHGRESVAFGAQLAGRFSLVRAVSQEALVDPRPLAAWAPLITRFVVDGQRPGSGQSWDHGRLQSAGLREGRLFGVPVWLAGGLTPGNVGDAIRLVRPAGVDVASGIEQDGCEDVARIAAFCRAAREAAATCAEVEQEDEQEDKQ